MKHVFTFLFLMFSSLTFAQNMGLIVGKVVDKEMNQEPLIYANISIKGTPIESDSDITGLYILENLKDGNYTLVCSFIGYETKEQNIQIVSGQPTQVNFSLEPTTISLHDLASLNTIAKDVDKISVALNN
ncbi:carboxypeptidase-like regulatory domain-containing protein [Yeosuana sp.]|uniref:carboxypeptidase-like regulatory domain-containing protein n=1 Tax=Yeosuana sp. TaxID=2529388 RepID=UPI004054E9E6